MNEKEIRYIDLFGGIGGFHLGLQQANDIRCIQPKGKKRQHSGNTPSKLYKGKQKWFSCVWYCDKDKYSCQTYNKNFKTQYEPTDITTIKPSDIPDFDMLCAGFPCQSFSIAGKRKGFQDIRGTMFFQIYRIASEKKPRLLFLENVKGLLSADDGRCFSTILSSLQKLGYSCEWQVLNSKNYGVPQNRERVFIIGHLRGTGGREIFPLRQDYCEDNGEEGCTSRHTMEKWNQGRGKGNVPRSRRQGEQDDNTSRGGLQSDDTRNKSQIKRVGHMNKFRRYNQTYETDGIVEALDTSSGGGHQPCIIDRADMRRDNGTRGATVNNEVCPALRGRDYKEPKCVTRIPLKYLNRNQKNIQGDYSFTVDGANTGGVMMNTLTEATGNRAGSSKESLRTVDNINKTTGQIRRLTPVECERLQGFPDNWTEGVSDTQRYKQLGNAVTVNVIQAIGMRILDCV